VKHVKVICASNIDPARIGEVLKRNDLLHEALAASELSFLASDGTAFMHGSNGDWQVRYAAADACDASLVLFSDNVGHVPSGLVRDAYAKFSEKGVWFLEWRGRYAPYRMKRSEFERLEWKLSRFDRYRFAVRVMRKLLKEWRLKSYPETRQLIDRVWSVARPIVEAAEANGSELWQCNFRDYFLGYGSRDEVTLEAMAPYVNLLFFVKHAIQRPLSGRLVEMGCGYGIQSVLFALHSTDLQVVALDAAPSCVESVSHLADRVPNLDGVLASAEGTGLASASTDFIFSSEAVQHFRHVGDAFREAHRILRPGGLLIVDEVNLEGMDNILLAGCTSPYRMAPLAEYELRRKAMIKNVDSQIPEDELDRFASATVGLEEKEIRQWLRNEKDEQVLNAMKETRSMEGEFFAQRRLDGWCEERFFSAHDLESRMHKAGFNEIRTLFHINAQIQVPGVLRHFADRILVIGRRR
jgi:SAM-dependent methyltransferase